MPDRDGRTTESEFAEAVCNYLAKTPKGWASLADINRHLTYKFPLTEADKEPSGSRDNERMWEQQVRNIISHRNSDGNAIHDGYLIYEPGTLEITDKGRAFSRKTKTPI